MIQKKKFSDAIAANISVVEGLLPLKDIYDGVFIMFHRKSDDYPLCVKPDKWQSYQDSGEIADGVLISEGGRNLVVAPTDATLRWSSAAVSGGGTTTSDRLTALDDFNGKNNTASQITHTECQGKNNAPGFCSLYSRTNANGKGLTAGKWWLPSAGELMLMYSNIRRINHCLSLIAGATQLPEGTHWASTEFSSTDAWFLNFSYGSLFWCAKVSYQFRVRPVSAFIS
ncbi:hypothetical protein [uncultured Bacteroides sp.]|uniref:hypothetical protein n=1 Tax=uncultured Bacteroides sp. TaxID=162156 RepID=UPI002609F158|nr:hypothetical protein [uncultured Bacteroides sp.]